MLFPYQRNITQITSTLIQVLTPYYCGADVSGLFQIFWPFQFLNQCRKKIHPKLFQAQASGRLFNQYQLIVRLQIVSESYFTSVQHKEFGEIVNWIVSVRTSDESQQQLQLLPQLSNNQLRVQRQRARVCAMLQGPTICGSGLFLLSNTQLLLC